MTRPIPPASTQPHVAILDDEPEIRRMLADALEEAGFRTTSFGRATEFEAALRMLRDQLDEVVGDIRPHDQWLCKRVEALYRDVEERLAELRLDMREKAE